jgi:putative addiction module killer protein
MFTIRKHEAFEHWISSLRDFKVQVRLLKRLKKVELGLLGDVKPVGEGVFEMRGIWAGLAYVLRPARRGHRGDARRWRQVHTRQRH